jgi:putative DNA primase/helicase
MTETRFIRYAKVERAIAPWGIVQDTSEAIEAAKLKGAMFVTTPALSFPYSDNGPEPVRRDNLVLDLDDKANPNNALHDLRRLCCFFLPETYGIPTWDINFFCSGGKGFHAEVPAHFFGLEDGHPELPLIYKRLVRGWVDKLKLTTIDLSMYAMKRGKMFRLPNVKRSNGRYKVELTRDDVAYCDIESLWSLSDSPSGA